MSGLKKLAEGTKDIPLGIAILNAGFGTSGTFATSNLETELNLLDLNCRAILYLTHHFIQQLMQKKQRGTIVLMSSMVAFQGVPNAANYAASKAYVQSFGEALVREVKPQNIDILCAAPGPVESNFGARANMHLKNAMQSDTIAKSIINAIGKSKTILPGIMTKFLVYNLRLLPRWIKIRIMGLVMKGFTKHQNA